MEQNTNDPGNKKIITGRNKHLLYPVVIVALIIISYSFIIISGSSQTTDENTSASMELKSNMRKLWTDHVTWTRNVVFNIMDNLPGTDQAVNRLLKNQDDIGNAIQPFYGAEAGKKLSALLRSHITIAAEVLKAAKSDNKNALDDANKRWFANADEISEFLGKANPSWKVEEMKKMMHTHLDLLTDETMARKKKDYDADVKAYDKTVDEILEMSDMLSMGIIKQFPDKFKETEMGQR